jgi:hypothetical protein
MNFKGSTRAFLLLSLGPLLAARGAAGEAKLPSALPGHRRPDPRLDEVWRRVRETLAKILLQWCTLINERLFTGFMHVFIFYGALTFDTMTVNHTLEGFFDGFYLFGKTSFGLLYFEMSAVSLHPEAARLSFLGPWLGGRFMGSLDAAALNAHFKASW